MPVVVTWDRRKSIWPNFALNILANPACIEKSRDTACPSDMCGGQSTKRSPGCSISILSTQSTNQQNVLNVELSFTVCNSLFKMKRTGRRVSFPTTLNLLQLAWSRLWLDEPFDLKVMVLEVKRLKWLMLLVLMMTMMSTAQGMLLVLTWVY